MPWRARKGSARPPLRAYEAYRSGRVFLNDDPNFLPAGFPAAFGRNPVPALVGFWNAGPLFELSLRGGTLRLPEGLSSKRSRFAAGKGDFSR